MKDTTVLAKIVAAITGAVDFRESDQLVLHFREVGRPGEGVVIVDRGAAETTVIAVSNESHMTRPAATPNGMANTDLGIVGQWSPRGHCRG
jgi:hypothetical protein